MFRKSWRFYRCEVWLWDVLQVLGFLGTVSSASRQWQWQAVQTHVISPSKAQTLQGWRISVLSTGLLSIAVSLLVSNLAMQGFEYHLLRFSDPPLLHDMYNCVCISSLQPQVGVGAALFVSPGIHLHPREKVALAMREPPREAPLTDLEQGTRQTLIYNVYHLVGLFGSRYLDCPACQVFARSYGGWQAIVPLFKINFCHFHPLHTLVAAWIFKKLANYETWEWTSRFRIYDQKPEVGFLHSYWRCSQVVAGSVLQMHFQAFGISSLKASNTPHGPSWATTYWSWTLSDWHNRRLTVCGNFFGFMWVERWSLNKAM